MYTKIIKTTLLSLMAAGVLAAVVVNAQIQERNIPVVYHIENEHIEKAYISEEEVRLAALIVMAEAESESEVGKRLVADVIFNRVDSQNYPDTVSEVVYQPNQFTVFDNGRIERVKTDEEICRLVREEFYNRTDSEVIFFNPIGYSRYGIPLYKEGNHYFSKE